MSLNNFQLSLIEAEEINADKIQDRSDQAYKKLGRLEVFEDLIHTTLHAVFLCRNNHLDQVERCQPEQKDDGKAGICLAGRLQLGHMIIDIATDEVHESDHADVCLFHLQGRIPPFSLFLKKGRFYACPFDFCR